MKRVAAGFLLLVAGCGGADPVGNAPANAPVARGGPVDGPAPDIKLPDDTPVPAREWPMPTAEVDETWPVLLASQNPQSASLLDYSFNGGKPGHSSYARQAAEEYIARFAGEWSSRDYAKLNQTGAVFPVAPSLSAMAIEYGWGMLTWSFATVVLELPTNEGPPLRHVRQRVFKAPNPSDEPPPPEQPPESQVEFPKDEDADAPEPIDERCWVRAVVDRNAGTYGIALMHGELRRNFSATAFDGTDLWADDKINTAEYRRVRDALVNRLLQELKPGTNVHIDFQQANKPKGVTRYIPCAVFFLMWDAARLALHEVDPQAKVVLGGW